MQSFLWTSSISRESSNPFLGWDETNVGILEDVSTLGFVRFPPCDAERAERTSFQKLNWENPTEVVWTFCFFPRRKKKHQKTGPGKLKICLFLACKPGSFASMFFFLFLGLTWTWSYSTCHFVPPIELFVSQTTTRLWFQPIWNILVKLDHFPK